MIQFDTIVIMAAGDSSRFWPLSDKHILAFMGKPVIWHVIDSVKAHARQIIVVVSAKNSEEIKRKLSDIENITFVIQKGNGQAAALLSASERIVGTLLVLNGSDLFDTHIIDEISTKLTEHWDGVFVGRDTDSYFPGGYIAHEGDKVVRVVEKPGADNMPSNQIKLVIDAYKDGADFIQTLESASSEKDDVYEQAISNYIKTGKNITYVSYNAFWYALKYPWHVLDVTEHFLSKVKSYRGQNVTVDDKAIIEGEVYIGDNVTIHAYAKVVGPCHIGSNSIIGNYAMVRDSIIGSGCLIGGYSEVTRSYFGNNVYLHRNYVGDSVLENDILFGAEAVCANFRFDEKTISSVVKGERIDTQKTKFGVIIGSNSKVGVNSSLMPGIKIGSNVFVPPHTLVKSDVEQQ